MTTFNVHVLILRYVFLYNRLGLIFEGFGQSKDLKEQSRPCVSKLTSADVRDSGGVNSVTSLVHVMNSF